MIEDIIPIFYVGVSVRSDSAPHHVQCVPDDEALKVEHRAGRLHFVIPKVEGHQMVEIREGVVAQV